MYEGSAAAFISNDHKILLHNRAKDGKSRFGEGWGLIGGRKEGEETPLQTLKRELHEELGYEVAGAKYINDYYSKKSDLLVHLFVVDFPGISAFSATPEGDIRDSLELFTFAEAQSKSILGLGAKMYEDLNDLGYLK
jgi:8-oxo-dGTP pyrophosphatase MutT (NUDIX family)